jgi:hypothetical protein
MTPRHADMDEVAEHVMETRNGGAVIVDGVRLPLGCDYQGQWPQAAEAATEIGADDDPPRDEGIGAIAWPLLSVMAICAVVLVAHVGARLWGGV